MVIDMIKNVLNNDIMVEFDLLYVILIIIEILLIFLDMNQIWLFKGFFFEIMFLSIFVDNVIDYLGDG